MKKTQKQKLGPGVPKIFLKLKEDCEKEKFWKKKKVLGEGSYGMTYHVCKVNDCTYALKVQEESVDFFNEVHCLMDMRKSNIVPKIYAAWTCNNYGFIVTEQLFPCPKSTMKRSSKTWKEVSDLTGKLENKGWLHVDTHPGNIMCNKKGKKILIDFGWAVKKGKRYYLPKHGGISKENNMKFTFNEIKVSQELNIEYFFGDNDPALYKLDKKWNKIIMKRMKNAKKESNK